MPMSEVSRSTVRAAVCDGLIAARLLRSPLTIRRVLCAVAKGIDNRLTNALFRAVKTSDELTARSSALS